MLDIEKKAKRYLTAMDRMIMGCDTEDELRMLACTILDQQIGSRGTKKLMEHTMEARHGADTK